MELQEEIDRLIFQYSELEKAYDKIINRDQFIVDLLEELSAAEVLIKNIREDSLHQISSLNAEIEALRSRSLWQCICSK
jgi:chaperonin cofactor prefoldin